MSNTGYLTLEFSSDAGETAEALIGKFKSYCVEITDAAGVTGDYILWGSDVWDGHVGQPVKVQRCGPGSEPIGGVFALDAVRIYIY